MGTFPFNVQVGVRLWKARGLKVFQNVTERLVQIISGIWTEIAHNRRGSLDNIKGNMQQAEL